MKSKTLQNIEHSYITIGRGITTLWDLAETLPYGHGAERLVRQAEKLLYEARTQLKEEMDKIQAESNAEVLEKLMQ